MLFSLNRSQVGSDPRHMQGINANPLRCKCRPQRNSTSKIPKNMIPQSKVTEKGMNHMRLCRTNKRIRPHTLQTAGLSDSDCNSTCAQYVQWHLERLKCDEETRDYQKSPYKYERENQIEQLKWKVYWIKSNQILDGYEEKIADEKYTKIITRNGKYWWKALKKWKVD